MDNESTNELNAVSDPDERIVIEEFASHRNNTGLSLKKPVEMIVVEDVSEAREPPAPV